MNKDSGTTVVAQSDKSEQKDWTLVKRSRRRNNKKAQDKVYSEQNKHLPLSNKYTSLQGCETVREVSNTLKGRYPTYNHVQLRTIENKKKHNHQHKLHPSDKRTLHRSGKNIVILSDSQGRDMSQLFHDKPGLCVKVS